MADDNVEETDHDKLFEELFGYLRDQQNKELALKASQIVLSLSNDLSLVEFAQQNPKTVLSALMRRVGGDETIARNCLTTLVNMCEHESIVSLLVKENSINRIFSDLRNQSSPEVTSTHEELNLMMLANMSRLKVGVTAMMEHPLLLNWILGAFFNPPKPSSDHQYKDKFIFVAHIITNATAHTQTRHILFNDPTSMAIATQLSKQLPISSRTSLVLDCLKHICLDESLHKWLAESNCQVIPRLCCMVYPPKGDLSRQQNMAANAESQDTARTLNPIVDEFAFGLSKNEADRRGVLSCLIALTMSCAGREGLRNFGVYEVLRLWHLLEPVADIAGRISEIVHLVAYSEEELKQQDEEENALTHSFTHTQTDTYTHTLTEKDTDRQAQTHILTHTQGNLGDDLMID